MKQRFFAISVLIVFTMMCGGIVVDAKAVRTKKSLKTHITKKSAQATKKVSAKNVRKTAPVPIQSSAPREETFAQFFSRQSKKRQTCIRNSLGVKKTAGLVRDSEVALGGADVKKVSRCVHHFIEY